MLGHCWVPGGNSQRCIWQPGSFPTAKLWISSHWIKSRKSICSRWERAENKNQSNAKLDQIRDVTELCPQHWPIHRCLGGSVSSICKEAKNCRSLMIEIRAHIKFGCSFVQKAHTLKLIRWIPPSKQKSFFHPPPPDLDPAEIWVQSHTEDKGHWCKLTFQQSWFTF